MKQLRIKWQSFIQIMNEKKQVLAIRTSLILVGLHASMFSVFAEEEQNSGVNGQAFKDLIDSFINPIKDGILYAIPASAAIGIGIMALKNFFKSEEQKEEFDLIGKIVKTGMIAGLAQSVALVLKIFNVV
ncbi:hypothetical protein G7059_00090 [Erysipelothrix sp. HDW6A]|uniref:hypothetical protein n=1 Tax=Erysipelothrix sp. HDW6A TaxID=2714928 RepID=UPI00140965F5|nr:hypothetical protein [Erysipelothrix sp. HDW6A]QIK56354.1 hypothetical protein G7059_00090 [Erysipelothrix sp. HDW6A]